LTAGLQDIVIKARHPEFELEATAHQRPGASARARVAKQALRIFLAGCRV
jgi:hypothetical protein